MMTITRLHDYGTLCISGPDAYTFLQSQLTCDVTRVTPNVSVLGASCNVKGRLLAMGRLYKKDDRNLYFFRLPKTLLPTLQKAWMSYAALLDVNLVDVSYDQLGVGLSGFEADTWLQKRLGFVMTADQHVVLQAISVICTPIAVPRFELYGHAACIERFLACATLVHEGSCSAWERDEICFGMPEITLETYEKFLPHNLNLHALGVLSFSKGCYLGQEIIARVEHRAKQKKRGLVVSTVLCPSSPKSSDLLEVAYPTPRVVGTVVRVAPGLCGGFVVLAEMMLQDVQGAQLLLQGMPVKVLKIF